MIKKTKIIDAFSKVKDKIDKLDWFTVESYATEGTWRKMRKPPEWVKDASSEYSLGKPRRSWGGGSYPYDKSKIFYGKTYVYKVFYETIAQGQVKPHFYRRLKKQKNNS